MESEWTFGKADHHCKRDHKMKFYLAIIFFAMMIYFLLRPGEISENNDSSTYFQQDVLAVREERPKNTQKNVVDEKVANIQANESPSLLETNEVIARENMGSMLRQLAECTEIKNSPPTSTPDATLASVIDSVQSELGEPVIRSEDWNSMEINMPDNTKRLVRIETVYENDDIVKKLKYYQVTPSQLIPIELSSEQAVNPSESFLASIEKEGAVVAREKSERVFFQNGEEISYTEKNGQIQNSEIIRAGKSLKCTEYGTRAFRCQCF